MKNWEYHLFNSDTAKFGTYTKEAKGLLKKIKDYAESFNFDDSDMMTDYFHSNFYLHVRFGDY